MQEEKAKKTILLKAIGRVVYRYRGGKGVNLIYYAYGISTSSVLGVEKGEMDLRICTLWKLAEILGLSFDKFVAEVLKELPEGFSMVDDN
jgi:transcriptional regulator with XRE-family HTH domain